MEDTKNLDNIITEGTVDKEIEDLLEELGMNSEKEPTNKELKHIEDVGPEKAAEEGAEKIPTKEDLKEEQAAEEVTPEVTKDEVLGTEVAAEDVKADDATAKVDGTADGKAEDVDLAESFTDEELDAILESNNYEVSDENRKILREGLSSGNISLVEDAEEITPEVTKDEVLGTEVAAEDVKSDDATAKVDGTADGKAKDADLKEAEIKEDTVKEDTLNVDPESIKAAEKENKEVEDNTKVAETLSDVKPVDEEPVDVAKNDTVKEVPEQKLEKADEVIAAGEKMEDPADAAKTACSDGSCKEDTLKKFNESMNEIFNFLKEEQAAEDVTPEVTKDEVLGTEVAAEDVKADDATAKVDGTADATAEKVDLKEAEVAEPTHDIKAAEEVTPEVTKDEVLGTEVAAEDVKVDDATAKVDGTADGKAEDVDLKEAEVAEPSHDDKATEVTPEVTKDEVLGTEVAAEDVKADDATAKVDGTADATAEKVDLKEAVNYKSLKEACLLEGDYFSTKSYVILDVDDKVKKLNEQMALLIARESADPIYSELLKTTILAKKLQERLVEKYSEIAGERANQLIKELEISHDDKAAEEVTPEVTKDEVLGTEVAAEDVKADDATAKVDGTADGKAENVDLKEEILNLSEEEFSNLCESLSLEELDSLNFFLSEETKTINESIPSWFAEKFEDLKSRHENKKAIKTGNGALNNFRTKQDLEHKKNVTDKKNAIEKAKLERLEDKSVAAGKKDRSTIKAEYKKNISDANTAYSKAEAARIKDRNTTINSATSELAK